MVGPELKDEEGMGRWRAVTAERFCPAYRSTKHRAGSLGMLTR